MSVVLRCSRARIDTPWGDIGAALNGGGNLRRDFTGKLALVAPRIVAAGCDGDDVSFYGTVLVRDVRPQLVGPLRSEEHTSELQSLMRISYAVFCLKKQKT